MQGNPDVWYQFRAVAATLQECVDELKELDLDVIARIRLAGIEGIINYMKREIKEGENELHKTTVSKSTGVFIEQPCEEV